MVVIALYGTFTGKLPGRFGGGSSRAKDPQAYWWSLAAYYLVGIAFIGYYLYLTHLFSNGWVPR